MPHREAILYDDPTPLQKVSGRFQIGLTSSTDHDWLLPGDLEGYWTSEISLLFYLVSEYALLLLLTLLIDFLRLDLLSSTTTTLDLLGRE